MREHPHDEPQPVRSLDYCGPASGRSFRKVGWLIVLVLLALLGLFLIAAR